MFTFAQIINKRGEIVKFPTILIKNLLELASNFFILIFIILFSYGNISLISYTFIGMNILSLSIFSILILLISLIISFILKDKRYLSEFVSGFIKLDEKELIKEDEN